MVARVITKVNKPVVVKMMTVSQLTSSFYFDLSFVVQNVCNAVTIDTPRVHLTNRSPDKELRLLPL